jgi:asparagine N-glycosylation enzyme membrane subunit Stt3
MKIVKRSDIGLSAVISLIIIILTPLGLLFTLPFKNWMEVFIGFADHMMLEIDVAYFVIWFVLLLCFNSFRRKGIDDNVPNQEIVNQSPWPMLVFIVSTILMFIWGWLIYFYTVIGIFAF